MAYKYSAWSLRLIKGMLPRRPRISGQAFEKIKEFGLLRPFRSRKKNNLCSEDSLNSIPVRITRRTEERLRFPYVNKSTLIDITNTKCLNNLASMTKTTDVSKFTCGLMNCQSINQKKVASLSNLILENNYQCVALTETLAECK